MGKGHNHGARGRVKTKNFETSIYRDKLEENKEKMGDIEGFGDKHLNDLKDIEAAISNIENAVGIDSEKREQFLAGLNKEKKNLMKSYKENVIDVQMELEAEREEILEGFKEYSDELQGQKEQLDTVKSESGGMDISGVSNEVGSEKSNIDSYVSQEEQIFRAQMEKMREQFQQMKSGLDNGF